MIASIIIVKVGFALEQVEGPLCDSYQLEVLCIDLQTCSCVTVTCNVYSDCDPLTCNYSDCSCMLNVLRKANYTVILELVV